jgi:hypothetical protein
MNDDVWVSITTSGGTDFHDVLGVQLLDEALYGCDIDNFEEWHLDDLEVAANAIARHFFKDVISLRHARDRLDKPADLAGTCPDPEDPWKREMEEWERELEEWIWS